MFYVESRIITQKGKIAFRQYSTLDTYNEAIAKIAQAVTAYCSQKAIVIGIIRHNDTILSVKRYGGYSYRRRHVYSGR